jgi:Methyltransferase domain
MTSDIRRFGKAMLPSPVRRRVVSWRSHRRRRREQVEFYGPAHALDLTRVQLLRSVPRDTLTSSERLEGFLPTLGLNNEQIEELPTALHPMAGTGLLHWQYPNQFSRYLVELRRHPIRGYLEIGTRHGGTFIITVEFLRRFGPIEWAIGIDLQATGELAAYAAAHDGVEALQLDSGSRAFRSLVRSRAPIDLVLIDGDHSEDGCRSDFLAVHKHARMIAFHDIANDLVPGVGAVWQEVKETMGDRFRYLEFTAQYPEVRKRVGASLLGIGLAIDAEWERKHGQAED